MPTIDRPDDISTAGRPAFLDDYAAPRVKRRITPVSRTPVTARLGDVWHAAASRGGGQQVLVDRPADIDPQGATRRSYAEWAQLVDDLAGSLWRAGVRPWDRVAVMKANHLDVALLGSAAARLGAVPALLAWTHTPDVARALLSRLDRPFLITDAVRVDQCDLDESVVRDLTARTISVDATPGRPDILPWADLRGAAHRPPTLRAENEPMVITHTSGTTGIPKLVMHSADSARSLALVEAERWPVFGLRTRDTMAFADPYCHQRMTTGLAAMATVTPELLMISDPLAPEAKALLLERPPTVMETLPNVYLAWEDFARDPARPFRDVRVFINSFDAIHTRTIRTFLHATDRRMPLWIQSWSQSEAGAMVIRPYTRRSVRPRGHRPPPTQALGHPIPSVCKIRAVDPETGRQLPAGQVGLIEVSQPGRCLAYVGEQQRHRDKRNGEWWNTGDLGVLDRFGAVRLIDREVDRIPGTSALELEDVLLDRLPQTTEVIVLPNGGSLPVPVLSTVDDEPVTAADWQRATADLPPMAAPVHIRWDDFPRTATWKVRRIHLRERLLHDAHALGLGRWT